MFVSTKQAKISNPRILGLLIFVANLFCFINLQSAENGSPNSNVNLSVKTHRILITSFEFKPDFLSVNVGDKIIWINKDFAPHNISQKMDNGKIDPVNSNSLVSPNLMKKEKFEMTIEQGFDYFCGLHPSMKGKIVIRTEN